MTSSGRRSGGKVRGALRAVAEQTDFAKLYDMFKLWLWYYENAHKGWVLIPGPRDFSESMHGNCENPEERQKLLPAGKHPLSI